MNPRIIRRQRWRTHQKVALHARRGPQVGIGPSLDPTLFLRENENRAALDDAPFLELMEPACYAGHDTHACRLEHEQCILRGLDPSAEYFGLGRSSGSRRRCEGLCLRVRHRGTWR